MGSQSGRKYGLKGTGEAALLMTLLRLIGLVILGSDFELATKIRLWSCMNASKEGKTALALLVKDSAAVKLGHEARGSHWPASMAIRKGRG
jgi:hypothetical protein